jgi:hypothetical protein
MIAMGPDIKQNTIVNRRIESIDLTPSVAALLGCDAPMAHGKLIGELGL